MRFALRWWAVALGVVLSLAGTARAHFIWLDPGKPGSGSEAVRVYFSEAAEPGDPALLERVEKAQVWQRTLDGGFRLLKLRRTVDALGVDGLGRGASCVGLSHTYGVVTRGGESFLLKYYAKTFRGGSPADWQRFGTTEQLALEIVPRVAGEKLELAVFWKGVALPDAEVVVLGPELPKFEGKTDRQGRLTRPIAKPGLYSIRSRHVEDSSGTREGKTYTGVRHYSTLTLPIGVLDATLAAAAREEKAGDVEAAARRAAEAPSASDVWPGFRGVGDSVTRANNLPLTWSETENIVWKIELPGYGQSSPVVWKDRVFVTAVAGSQRETGFVACYDTRTGAKKWVHEFEPTQKAKWSNMVSRAAPTPVVDAAAVYAFFEGGNLLALSHDGKLLWSRSLVADYGEFQNGHGLGSSLAQSDDGVFVLIDHRGPSYLLAVDKQTGRTLWKTDRTSRSSWTSPIVLTSNGKPQVVVSSAGSVSGYDARCGDLLWELDGLGGNTIPSASAAGNLVLIGAGTGIMGGSGGSPRGQRAGESTAGAAGQPGQPASRPERGAGTRRGPDPQTVAKSNICLRIVEKDGPSGYELCWTAAKATASYATPLVHRGHAYFVNQVGAVFFIDLASGEEQYAERLDGPCWASPIGAGDYIFFFGKNGRTTVLKAGPTFQKVALNRLWDPDTQRNESPLPDKPSDTPAEKQAPGAAREPSADYLDPLVYGVAAVDGAFFVRTGTRLCRIGIQR